MKQEWLEQNKQNSQYKYLSIQDAVTAGLIGYLNEDKNFIRELSKQMPQVDEELYDGIIVTSGSYNPWHYGHEFLIDRAINETQYKKPLVIIFPAHDIYLQEKCPDNYLPASIRIERIKNSIPEDWFVSGAEAYQEGPVNYSSLLSALRLIYNLPITYVYGEDCKFDKYFYHAWIERIRGLSFSRTEDSSTNKRKNWDWKDYKFEKKHLKLRIDISLYNPRQLVKILDVLEKYYLSVTLLDIHAQLNTLKQIDPFYKSKAISLDKHTPTDYNLKISRIYQPGGFQFVKYHNHQDCYRSDLKDILYIIDDDIDTGGSLRKCFDFLGREMPIYLHTGKTDKNCEILDWEDFFGEGLYIKQKNNMDARRPYLLPYVDPYFRCSVDPTKIFEFDKDIKELIRDL